MLSVNSKLRSLSACEGCMVPVKVSTTYQSGTDANLIEDEHGAVCQLGKPLVGKIDQSSRSSNHDVDCTRRRRGYNDKVILVRCGSLPSTQTKRNESQAQHT